jgi:hypothetical protein
MQPFTEAEIKSVIFQLEHNKVPDRMVFLLLWITFTNGDVDPGQARHNDDGEGLPTARRRLAFHMVVLLHASKGRGGEFWDLGYRTMIDVRNSHGHGSLQSCNDGGRYRDGVLVKLGLPCPTRTSKCLSPIGRIEFNSEVLWSPDRSQLRQFRTIKATSSSLCS